MRFDFRFAIAATVLASTAFFLDIRHRYEILPARQPLSYLPRQLGAWRGTDVSISPDVLEALGQGDFLSRTYRDDVSTSSYTDVFIAYFPSQRAGDTIHSPQNCLRGSGWFPLESNRITLAFPGRAPFPANLYLIGKGEDRALVLYWYWAHDRAVASEYWAKVYLVADAVRLNRTDGAMIRITTPLRDESAGPAKERLIALAREIVPLISNYAPP